MIRLTLRLAILIVLGTILGMRPANPEDIPSLCRDGISVYTIVLAESASPSEQQAAQELQRFFESCTGALLPISHGSVAPETPSIVLGFGSATALGVNSRDFDLGEQGYVLRTISPHLLIAGTPEAGTLYGVYAFLERYLKVRWYAPGVTAIPKTDTLALPEVDVVEKPAFLWRHTSYTWPGKEGEFLVHVRDNAGSGGPEHPLGIQHAHHGRAHSYFSYVNPSEFYDTHPEYFSEVGGERLRFETQLCLTNPEVLEIVADRMIGRMREQPEYRQYNFSQMDYYNYCQCEDCAAMNAKYETAGGTQFWFVNQLAERTAKVFPDKLIGTLAYTYTEAPPKGMTMHPNVAVWLCHMFPSCDSHPIASCPLDADYKRRAEAWSKQCGHLYIWHYIVDFAHYFNPFPNFGAMAADMRFYRDIGVEGIYLQAMGHGGGGGEWSLLRPYYGMKLLWDPDQDPDALLRDFLGGYYGDAAGPLWEYISLLQKKVDEENIHMHLYTNPAQGYLPDEVLAQAMALFDQAEDAVRGEEELLERVRVARMPLTYARTFPRNGYQIESGYLKYTGDFAPMEEVQAFLDRCQAHGFQAIREWGGDPQQLTALAFLLHTPLPLITLSNPHLSVDILPALGGRVLRITDQATGKCLTAHNIARNLYFPFAGGEETRLGGIYGAGMAGNMEVYVPVETTGNSVKLQGDSGTLRMLRSIEIDPLEPGVTVTVEAKNIGDKPAEVRLHSHLELDLGVLEESQIQFTNRSGAAVEQRMPEILAGKREGKYFRDEHTPLGSWSFSGTGGFRVSQSFDDAVVDFTWAYGFPADLGELEVEVWRKAEVVAPDASLSLTHTLRVTPER